MNDTIISNLTAEIQRQPDRRRIAIALDFDGVCKLFTDHKHQIMFTGLFLNLREFQRVPFDEYRKAYIYINFRSADYAGKERFLCVAALARHLAQDGHDCLFPGLQKAVAALTEQGLKISEKNLLPYQADPDVARVLTWSREVNERVAQLSEIGLTAGIRENILTPFEKQCDFYVVSTATEAPLRASLEHEKIFFIRRYIGQETAGKAEALTALGRSGYAAVIMFGDSVEDERASRAACAAVAGTARVFFAPVIPGDERCSFEVARRIVEAVERGACDQAERLCDERAAAFKGREAGSQALSPMTIRGAI